MESIINFQNLPIFFVCFVPGIVILYVRSLFLTGHSPPFSQGASTYVILSVLYHAAIYPFAKPLYEGPVAGGWVIFSWFIILFAVPSFLGLLWGLGTQKGWIRRLFLMLGLNVIHSVNTAWDWRFSGCTECWVLVVLKDGKKWAGHLGDTSFISSKTQERDIYIQTVYEINDDNKWLPRKSGVWLAGGEIQSIEFWPMNLGEKNA